MLSILIPTYKFNALPLVQTLHGQGVTSKITFEIICFDDGSNADDNIENFKINELPFAHFESLEKNIGLSENRNSLALKAQYEYFLFIDGDSLIPTNSFVANYLAILPTDGVIYGGRTHPTVNPAPNQQLRWKYGLFKEDKAAQERQKNPYQCLLFNNALINRECFKKIQFESEIRTYGHEDTLFAFKAKNLGISVGHIENPVSHKDIDTSEVYLQKTKMGLKNLKQLYIQQKIDTGFVTLLSYYERLETSKMLVFYTVFFNLCKTLMIKNLKSPKPSLIIFNLYKLGFFCSLNKKK